MERNIETKFTVYITILFIVVTVFFYGLRLVFFKFYTYIH